MYKLKKLTLSSNELRLTTLDVSVYGFRVFSKLFLIMNALFHSNLDQITR